MLQCCVSGCKNRYSPSSSIKFYRIPCGSGLIHVRRRRLWIEAIQRANGGSMDFGRNPRICGAHFISGEASMDQDRPDYVPSVFTEAKQRRSLHKKIKRSYGYRKRLRRRAKADTAEETPPDSDESYSPAELRSDGDLPAQTPSPPSLRKKKRRLTEETESTTNTIQSEVTSSPSKRSPSMTSLACVLKLDKMNPVVLLKTVIAPVGGYQCELCSQTCSSVSLYVKHQQQHEEEKTFNSGKAELAESPVEESPVVESPVVESPVEESPVVESPVEESPVVESPVVESPVVESPVVESPVVESPVVESPVEESPVEESPVEESPVEESPVADSHIIESHVVPEDEPSFPCNMCDRSFTTSQNLKRHKLLHVKDGRKCFKCGVLFCRRHNHVAFQPQIASKIESDEESSTSEEENSDAIATPEDRVLERAEPQQVAETADTQNSHDVSPTPLSSPPEFLPGIPPLSSLTRTPGLESVKPSPVPRPPSPILRFSNSSLKLKSQVPEYPSVIVQPHLPQNPELPSSLKLFSPQYLTSVFLKVQRNYNYILSKQRKAKLVNVVKVEPKEPVMICPEVKTVKEVKKEKIAYDLEIEI